jgi:Ni,Fe-hydrogenase III small subunit/ferredoxin
LRKFRCKRICRPKVTIKDLDRRPPSYADRWAPMLAGNGCSGCMACAEVCPTGAIAFNNSGQILFKHDACIACRACTDLCEPGVLILGPGIGGAVTRSELSYVGSTDKASADEPAIRPLKTPGPSKTIKIFAKSMHVREVDCGSCNACELEIAAISNPVYDAERFGISFVASPRHADVLFVTGSVTRQMELALNKTMAATPSPKLVVAVGACACSGGLFGNTQFAGAGVDASIKVDIYIPGCPPSPRAILSSIRGLQRGTITRSEHDHSR